MATLKRLKLGRYPVPLVDVEDTELQRKEVEVMTHARLFDPPVDGATPLDGAGDPMTSQIIVRDVNAKLEQGFTLEPVVKRGKK